MALLCNLSEYNPDTGYVVVPRAWRCCSMHDPAGNEGIWYRIELDTSGKGWLVVRGGWLGLAAISRICPDWLPVDDFNELVSALDYGAWMRETNRSWETTRIPKCPPTLFANDPSAMAEFTADSKGYHVLPAQWRCCSMHDSALRRGIWYKVEANRLFLCGGREGTDARVTIEADRVSVPVFNQLVYALNCGAFWQEKAGPDIVAQGLLPQEDGD